MPRLPETLLDCVVYLYPSEAEAEDGVKLGGSGFLVGIPLVDENNMVIADLPCVVTNKHVIRNGNMTIRLNTKDGKTDTVALDGVEWIEHPNGDDVACCPIGLQRLHKHNYIPSIGIGNGNRSSIEQMQVGIGDDVFAVGRFINNDGKQTNTPTARFGHIAQMPIEPILQEDGFEQESFLVEARAIAGYSGSPVFWYVMPQPDVSGISLDVLNRLPLLHEKRRNMRLGWGPILLGISYCYIPAYTDVLIKATRKPHGNLSIKENTGMMGVIPAWKICDVVFGDKMSKIAKAASVDLQKKLRVEGSFNRC